MLHLDSMLYFIFQLALISRLVFGLVISGQKHITKAIFCAIILSNRNQKFEAIWRSPQERLSSALVAEILMNAIRKVNTSLNAANLDLSQIKCDQVSWWHNQDSWERGGCNREDWIWLWTVCRLVKKTMEDMKNSILLEGEF